jgi:hypothetical protein
MTLSGSWPSSWARRPDTELEATQPAALRGGGPQGADTPGNRIEGGFRRAG